MLKPKRLRILYIHHDALLTGSLVSLKNMVSALNKELYEPIVVFPTEGPAVESMKTIGITVYVCAFAPFFTTPGPRCFSRDNIKQLMGLFPSVKLRKLVKSLNPDLIHINDKAAMNAGLSCTGLNIPIVQHTRSAFHITACAINKWISTTFIRLYAKHVICISEDEEQGFEKMTNKTIVFNTVNQEQSEVALKKREQTRASLGIAPTDFVIGIAENLGVYKGLFEVIQLAEEILSKSYPVSVKFMLVGNISETDSLSRYGINLSSKAYVDRFINEKQYHQRIIVTGYRNDALDLIAAMDTILIAKAHGVLGRQPLEAQSVGVPVVAINGHSKRSSIVKHGLTGYLVNHFSELANAIEKIINNPDHKKKLSETGLQYAKAQFNPNTNIQRIQDIYQQTLAKS